MGENTREVPRDSQSEQNKSQITSTQRIMSSTVTRWLSYTMSLIGHHGGSDLTGKSRSHERRWGTYQLSHIYHNLLLSMATSRSVKKGNSCFRIVTKNL